ncbi:hypothetical protein AAC387_Pa07g2397 [Persea americana]
MAHHKIRSSVSSGSRPPWLPHQRWHGHCEANEEAAARRRRLRERDTAAALRPNRQPTCGAAAAPLLPPFHCPRPCLLSRPLAQDCLRLQRSYLQPKPYP